MPSRTLLPLEPSPVLLEDYPCLPCPPRSESFAPGYEITTHVFPSAYPRFPSSPCTPPPFPQDSPTDSKEWSRRTTQILAKQEGVPGSGSRCETSQLKHHLDCGESRRQNIDSRRGRRQEAPIDAHFSPRHWRAQRGSSLLAQASGYICRLIPV